MIRLHRIVGSLFLDKYAVYLAAVCYIDLDTVVRYISFQVPVQT